MNAAFPVCCVERHLGAMGRSFLWAETAQSPVLLRQQPTSIEFIQFDEPQTWTWWLLHCLTCSPLFVGHTQRISCHPNDKSPKLQFARRPKAQSLLPLNYNDCGFANKTLDTKRAQLLGASRISSRLLYIIQNYRSGWRWSIFSWHFYCRPDMSGSSGEESPSWARLWGEGEACKRFLASDVRV